MKYILTAIWALVCIGVLGYSHFSWNKQTAVQAVVPTQNEEKETNEVTIDQKYIELATNWPETAKKQLALSLAEGNPFKILFVGSTASEWESVVTANLIENYGSETVSTSLYTYDLTSTDFLTENKQQELAAEKAQMIVIEPLLFNDNGKIKIDGTLANLTTIIEGIKAENPDTTFILQPSYPIYLPKYYATQVDELKKYAEENNITYLDHWTAWPATDNIEIKDYLKEGQSGPNETGNQAWAQFLVEYFVNK